VRRLGPLGLAANVRTSVSVAPAFENCAWLLERDD
jgi:hypothetical protein